MDAYVCVGCVFIHTWVHIKRHHQSQSIIESIVQACIYNKLKWPFRILKIWNVFCFFWYKILAHSHRCLRRKSYNGQEAYKVMGAQSKGGGQRGGGICNFPADKALHVPAYLPNLAKQVGLFNPLAHWHLDYHRPTRKKKKLRSVILSLLFFIPPWHTKRGCYLIFKIDY